MNSNLALLIKSIVFIFLFTTVFSVSAQHRLNESETRWVEEAKSELEKALSDPDLSQQERIAMVERSAKTLKEYGQPAAFPKGNISLKDFMEENYNMARKQFDDSNTLKQMLAAQILDQQLKIINSIQIEVAGEQIKLMIPGKAAVDLSLDAVSTVFKWDIAEGFNNGQRGDVISLKNKFIQLAKSKELMRYLESLYTSQRMSMQQTHTDLNKVMPLQELLRRRYQMAEAGAFVFKGYEGAVAANTGSSSKSTGATSSSSSSYSGQNSTNRSTTAATKSTTSVSSDDNFKETKYYFRFVKASTVKKINKAMYVPSISNGVNSMSASVTPPEPKEPFSVSANWNSPPAEFYPGETITITAKGNGDVRMDIEASNASSVYKMVRDEYVDGNHIVNFSWKVNAWGSFYITVTSRVTAHVYAWSHTMYEYEMVIIE